MDIFKSLQADTRNALSDLYSSWVLGDDAGKSATLTLVLRPTMVNHRGKSRLDLGMKMIEINGRAYVHSVTPASPAANAGILPQDAIQYALVFKKEWANATDSEDDLMSAREAEELAVKTALYHEDRGLRTSYDELRKLLAEALDPTQSSFLSPPTATKAFDEWKGPPIPSKICVPMETSSDGYLGMSRPSSPISGEALRPVVFVFRRTRQRKALNLGLPGFRLDDECDFATGLVQRLAPTADMETPPPDTWEELVHDGTDWLLGPQSATAGSSNAVAEASGKGNAAAANDEDAPTIPYDDFEQRRLIKLSQLRSKMAAEALQNDRTEDVEAATIRGMIQKSVGLAFVRASKVVLGVSIHAGSGIVISRLPDGTWSAPSAIGTWGFGLGLQFGLEVAEYIFILQTQEALEHFKQGSSFTVGGNMGVAVAGIGREAYGAASVGGACGSSNYMVKDDEYDDNDSRNFNKSSYSMGIAPIVAYAKSQGLYLGVSLEGSRLFSRDDINSRTYKFSSGVDTTAYDILSGRVATPHEAEELYAALHSVEFAHEMSCLPRPPEILRLDSANAWQYDKTTLGRVKKSLKVPFPFLPGLTKEEAEEIEVFEAQFKGFLYGGVSVQRLLPGAQGRSGRTGKERRTLWLMLPEMGSLQLGFVSKLSDGEVTVSNEKSTLRSKRDSNLDGDLRTVGSEELTLDSALQTRDTKDGASTVGPVKMANVKLSDKHCMALTDITSITQEAGIPIRLKGEDKMEYLRLINIQDVAGTTLLFLANNFREAELIVCGLKLLLERETSRLGVRGGLPLTAFGAKSAECAMSPSAARGYRDLPSKTQQSHRKTRSDSSAGSSSGMEDLAGDDHEELPDSRRAWGQVPGRNYMKVQASSSLLDSGELGIGVQGSPIYTHGKEIIRHLATNVRLPLPLSLCRVLLLESSSPVTKKWEKIRGDRNIDKTRWSFPPATPRESLQNSLSEHELITQGSMLGATRVCRFDRNRHGTITRLSETYVVECDDSRKTILAVSERNPRRGFAVRVHVVLQAFRENMCEASIIADLCPIGKDMSNMNAVHKAFLLAVDEIKSRYCREHPGLLYCFLSAVEDMDSEPVQRAIDHVKRFPGPFSRTGPEEKKTDDMKKQKKRETGFVSFSDMLQTSRRSPENVPNSRPSTPSFLNPVRENLPSKRSSQPSTVHEETMGTEKDSATIEVKPLPKIRLSLMPAPREEDEDDETSTDSPKPVKPVSKTRKMKNRLGSKAIANRYKK